MTSKSRLKVRIDVSVGLWANVAGTGMLELGVISLHKKSEA